MNFPSRSLSLQVAILLKRRVQIVSSPSPQALDKVNQGRTPIVWLLRIVVLRLMVLLILARMRLE